LNFDEIERILELVRQHELAEFELESDGVKLRVRKATAGFPPLSAPSHIFTQAPNGPAVQMVPSPVPLAASPAAAPIAAGSTASAGSAAEDEEVELAVVKSPIVGTFYGAPEPGAPPFVDVGQRVKKDQVLCIIEAMKLMNEITSEYEGEIVSIYVENGKPVQYGERLFAIRTR
jgi:acetyl-CoA carboxylase biotin carboxyl carrier protein